MADNGVDASELNVMSAMALPALGMFIGLLIAVFFSYRGGRGYDMKLIERTERVDVKYSPKTLIMALVAIVVAFVVQLWLGSMILGALAGFVLFNISVRK